LTVGVGRASDVQAGDRQLAHDPELVEPAQEGVLACVPATERLAEGVGEPLPVRVLGELLGELDLLGALRVGHHLPANLVGGSTQGHLWVYLSSMVVRGVTASVP
jgi:hypothetical protein